MGFYVPKAMLKLNNWVVWKADKVPYSPKTGKRAKPNDRNTWSSYGEAVQAAQYGDYAGIGFVFTQEAGLVFIDLDRCINADGEESEFAKEIQAFFPGSYTEVSQSETGLHIICKGTLEKAFKRPEIEVYSSGRYVAFTGNATSPTEPQEAQESINILVQRYGRTEPPQAPKTAYTGKAAATVKETIAAIQNSRQGAKFDRLFNGDSSGYPGHSEADLAFIAIVNAFSNGNDTITTEIWNASERSKRMKDGRRKGSRADYLQSMIAKAKASYTGSTKTSRTLNPAKAIKQPEQQKGFFFRLGK